MIEAKTVILRLAPTPYKQQQQQQQQHRPAGSQLNAIIVIPVQELFKKNTYHNLKSNLRVRL